MFDWSKCWLKFYIVRWLFYALRKISLLLSKLCIKCLDLLADLKFLNLFFSPNVEEFLLLFLALFCIMKLQLTIFSILDYNRVFVQVFPRLFHSNDNGGSLNENGQSDCSIADKSNLSEERERELNVGTITAKCNETSSGTSPKRRPFEKYILSVSLSNPIGELVSSSKLFAESIGKNENSSERKPEKLAKSSSEGDADAKLNEAMAAAAAAKEKKLGDISDIRCYVFYCNSRNSFFTARLEKYILSNLLVWHAKFLITNKPNTVMKEKLLQFFWSSFRYFYVAAVLYTFT